MKKSIICVSLSCSLLFSSCLGSFNAFNNLKEWNQDLTDSRFVNNLVFWALTIIPVYGLFMLGDMVLFNVIEFWSGSNPIAMEDGQQEMQLVKKDGNIFELIASKNRMQVTVIDGPKKGEQVELIYKPEEKSWNATRPNGEVIKLSSFKEGLYIVHMPNGTEVKINPMASKEEGLSLINEYKECYYMESMMAAAN